MSLFIATPVRGHNIESSSVTVGYHQKKIQVMTLLKAETHPIEMLYSTDNVRARNRVVAYALDKFPDVSRVLFWDDDQWPYDIGIVKRMVDSGEHVIGAPYTTKGDDCRWVHYPEADDVDERGLLRVLRVGMGFTMVTRECLERVSACADEYYDTTLRRPIANIFGMLSEVLPVSPVPALMSEDFSFCKRWRDLGGTIWIDGRDGNAVAHVGTKVYDHRDMRR